MKQKTKNLDLTSFLLNNLWLLAFILLGYLLIAACATILPRLTFANGGSRLKNLKLLLFRALFMNHNRLPRVHLRLMFLFFGLFLFLDLNFFAFTIKTQKVTVDVDEIVESPAKLLKTSKTLIIDAAENHLFFTSPEGTLLKRLSEKKIFKVNSLSDLVSIKSKGINSFVAVCREECIYWVMGFLAKTVNDNGSVVFIKATNYYERLVKYLMRKNLDDERKRFINSR